MTGIVLSIVAGMAMSVQGVMNTRLGENIGTMHANALVQCTAAALSLAALLFAKDGSFAQLGQTNKLYWFGGVLGLVITVTVMLGIKQLSPTVAISIIAAVGCGAYRRFWPHGQREGSLHLDQICRPCADGGRGIAV